MFDHSYCQNIHSQSQNRRFKEFAHFRRKIPATKRPFAWGGGGWNAIRQNAVWTCIFLTWGFPKLECKLASPYHCFSAWIYFIVIFVPFAYLTKYFPPAHSVKLCLMLRATVRQYWFWHRLIQLNFNTGFHSLFTLFKTIDYWSIILVCINFCFLLHISYESGSDILLGVGPTLGVMAVPQFAISRVFVILRL